MGSASDRSPDPTRTTNWARPPLPTGPRGTALTPSSPAPPPSGREPKLLDRLWDTHRERHYSPRPEQGYRRMMLSEALKGPPQEHLVRVRHSHQQNLAEGSGSDFSVENARRRKMQRITVAEMSMVSPELLMANMGEGGHNQPAIKERWGIRKLTPRKCARLQGYEDDWFQIPASLAVDTPRSRYLLAASQSPDGPPNTMRCM